MTPPEIMNERDTHMRLLAPKRPQTIVGPFDECNPARGARMRHSQRLTAQMPHGLGYPLSPQVEATKAGLLHDSMMADGKGRRVVLDKLNTIRNVPTSAGVDVVVRSGGTAQQHQTHRKQQASKVPVHILNSALKKLPPGAQAQPNDHLTKRLHNHSNLTKYLL